MLAWHSEERMELKRRHRGEEREMFHLQHMQREFLDDFDVSWVLTAQIKRQQRLMSTAPPWQWNMPLFRHELDETEDVHCPPLAKAMPARREAKRPTRSRSRSRGSNGEDAA